MIQQNLLSFFQFIWRTGANLFWLSLWAFSLGILSSYLLRYGPGDRLFFVRLVNYLMPWLLLFLVPGLLIALVGRRQWLAVSFALPTLLILLNYAPLFLPRPSVALASDTTLKVMSYNIWSRNRDIESMTTLIKEEQPDILLLQEIKKATKPDNIFAALSGLYDDEEIYIIHDATVNQAVVSRYPLTKVEAAVRKGNLLEVLAETPNGTITVLNVHPLSNRGWFRRYSHMSQVLEEDILPNEGPVILGGDFNTTDQTGTYRLLDTHLNNAHWEAGWGFGFSFPSPTREFRDAVSFPSLVRIDHIFYNDYFFANEAETLPNSGGSDHLPVTATFTWIK